jgi:GAF domain-containing protein
MWLLVLCDPEAGTLWIAEQRGFSAPFLAFFAHVGPGTPSACAAAWSTRAPVVVDQVTRSPVFAGHPTLEALIDAGPRAVASYPLLGPGHAVAGVLSFHYPKPPTDDARAAMVARGAASALALLS